MRTIRTIGWRKTSLLGVLGTMFFITLLSSPLFAQEPVILDDTRDKYPLGLHLEILEGCFPTRFSHRT